MERGYSKLGAAMTHKLTRRNFLTFSALGLGATGAAAAFGVSNDFNYQSFIVERPILFVPNLPTHFDGYRIAFLADVHLGRFLPSEVVLDAIKALQAEKPDMLLLGGDYIWLPDRSPIDKLFPVRNNEFKDAYGPSGAQAIFERFADLVQAMDVPDGIFAVLGNHENWTGPHFCRRSFETRGIRLLDNDVATVWRGNQFLRLFGVADYWTAIPKLIDVGERKPGYEVRILLAHNPDYLSELLRRGTADFDCSIHGHTHGGQVCLPLIGALYYNIEDLRFAAGVVPSPNILSYVSRGLGMVEVPFRLNCPPEVTLLELRRA